MRLCRSGITDISISLSTALSQEELGSSGPREAPAGSPFDRSPWDDRQQVSNIDAVDLGPPISTLRSLGAMHGYQRAFELENSALNTTRSYEQAAQYGPYDPISNGILTMNEASRAIYV